MEAVCQRAAAAGPSGHDEATDDAPYVRKLFAILTNPSPTGIDSVDPYEQADDRIDRYGGFGRDLRVTSATVMPSEHGAMVELGYELEIPDRLDLPGVPRQNSIRLQVAAQWRAASNLDDPADYAPMVACRLMSSIHQHVSAHQSPATDRSDRLVAGEHWAVLIEHLGHEGTVRELPSGRIEVTQIRGGGEGEVVTVLVTPEQWELVMHRHIGPVPSDYFADLLGPRNDDELFLVF